jgi:N-hydroxyarylamine O-acetyltransferase
MVTTGPSALTPEQSDAYLERIGGQRPAHPDLNALCLLHERHVRSVPFENLSISADGPFSLASTRYTTRSCGDGAAEYVTS